MSTTFCYCGKALKTVDEHIRGCCNRCREAAAEHSLEDLTEDAEEDELDGLSLPLCSFCHVVLTDEQSEYCSDECSELDQLRPA